MSRAFGVKTMNTETTTPADDNHPHYQWGASAAKTWRGCPGSINYANQQRELGNIPKDDESEYAAEGTVAHNYAEKFLTGQITEEDIPANFWEHLQGYVLFAKSLAEEIGGGDCIVMNEQQVPLFYAPDHTGTLDYGVVAEDASELAILDLKYGAGVYVTAEENDQGAIYATSLIKQLEAEGYVFADDAKVSIYIYQPRHHSFSGDPESWVITYRELMDMAIDIENSYTVSLTAPVDALHPSEDACRFCDARVVCQKRVLDMFEDVPEEVNPLVPSNHVEPELPVISKLTDEARVAVFKHAKKIDKWLKDVMADTLARIEQGTPVEGLKTVDGREGNRTWGDNEADVEKLLRKIPAAKRYKPRRVLSPAQAEKVLKAEDKALSEQSTKFKNRWNELITRKAPTPALALEDDKRPARITGTDQFEVIEEVSEDDCF